MNRKDAKALCRWCETHQRQYERVHLENGVAVTGCRECVTGPAFVAAVDALKAAVATRELRTPPHGAQGGPSPLSLPWSPHD